MRYERAQLHSYWGISDEGIQALIRALQVNQRLIQLDISENGIPAGLVSALEELLLRNRIFLYKTIVTVFEEYQIPQGVSDVIFNYIDPTLLQALSSARTTTFLSSYKAVQEIKPNPLKVTLVKAVLEECRTKKDDRNLPSPELALCRAAAAGKVKCVETLIKHAENIDINRQGPETQRTALHFATIYNQRGIANLLIEAGARLDIPDFNNKTAIDYMAESEDQEMQELFKVVKKESQLKF